MSAVAIILLYGAFAMLALTQERHWEAVSDAAGMPASGQARPGMWRAAAALLFLGGLAGCVSGHGPGFGAILWVVLLGACGFAVAMTLAWAPAKLGVLARIMCR